MGNSYTGNWFPAVFSKPKPSNPVTTVEITDSKGTGNIPQAQLGSPVPLVLGQKRVPDANTIWTGNLRPLTNTTSVKTDEKETVGGEVITTTKTVTTTTVIGYLVDIHMAICLGPDVSLIAIYVDNQPIWTGNAGPARTTFTIGENLTFLSKANVVFSGGAFNQAPEPDVAVADYPGYVGVATILLKNVRADQPMGNLSFEVVRIPNPLALPDSTNKSGNDINIISALVEVMTNGWGYGGLDISNLDTTQFSAMALEMKNKSNFASLKINTETSIAGVIKSMQDQASALVFQHPETGKITGAIIDEDHIDFVALGKRFTPANIIKITNFQKNYWPNTIEQARALYTERDADYNEVPVFAQNAANVSQSGRGKRTATLQYPFVASKSLASQLLSRDLATFAAPGYSFSMTVNRDGAKLVPGDMITVTHPDYNMLNIPMCVLKVRKQPLLDNTVLLEVRQMLFPDTDPLYGTGGAAYDPGFDTKPKKPTAAKFITAPYFFARSARGVSSTQVTPLVYPVVMPKVANNVQYSFTALITNVPASPGDVTALSAAGYATYASLNGAIGQYDGYDTGFIPAVNIDGVINPVNLTNIGNSGIREGRLFVVINNEIMSFESFTDNGGGSYTLNNVYRSLLDTVVEAHADNSDIYIVSNNFNFVGQGFSYPLGYTPNWVLMSNSLSEYGVKADGFLTSGWTPSINRTLSPPCPHNTKVNGAARSSTAVTVTEGASTTVTWATRSRINTAVRLQTDAADTPEAGQKHRVFHRSSGGVVTEIGTMAYTGNSATFTMPDVANGAGTIYVQSEIVLGGVTYTSISQDRVNVNVV